jgi:hypothetical protein
VVLSSDSVRFGGFDRVDTSIEYVTTGSNPEVSLYLPNRTALVLSRSVA